MENTKIAAVEYVAAGWRLCEVPLGTKAPAARGWNLPENAISDVARAAAIEGGIGLCHAYSGTWALDIDDWAKAEAWLDAHGVSLRELWDAPDAVRIVSGRPGRGKLLYKCDTPFASKRPTGSGLEFRCATASGLTVQDVLPPSVHPGTGKPYRWDGPGSWRALPPTPSALSPVLDVLRPSHGALSEKPPAGYSLDAQRELLSRLDPACGYNDWIAVGMALHHENGGSDDGFALWDEWSAQASSYPGEDKLRQHWRSFGRTAGPVITMRSLGCVATADDFEAVKPPPEDRAAEQARRARFQLVPAPEYAASRSPSWIVKGVLPRAELAVVYGDSGSGKTFVVLDLVAAITRGIPWRGHRTKQGRVAYLCGEGADFFARRVAVYQQHHGCLLTELFVCADAPNLMRTSQDYKLLIEQLRARGPFSVVVIDTLSRSMPGGNENASEDMSSLVERCGRIHAATGALVLLVHHTGKDTARGARGHSSLRAAADAELAVVRDRENARRYIEVGKQKDGPDGRQFTFSLAECMLGHDEDGDPITSCVVMEVSDEGDESPLEV